MDHREDDSVASPRLVGRVLFAYRRRAPFNTCGRYARRPAGDLMRRTDIADGGRINPIDVDIFSGLTRRVADAQRLNVLCSHVGWQHVRFRRTAQVAATHYSRINAVRSIKASSRLDPSVDHC